MGNTPEYGRPLLTTFLSCRSYDQLQSCVLRAYTELVTA